MRRQFSSSTYSMYTYIAWAHCDLLGSEIACLARGGNSAFFASTQLVQPCINDRHPIHRMPSKDLGCDPCLTYRTGGQLIGQGNLDTWPPTDRHGRGSSDLLAHLPSTGSQSTEAIESRMARCCRASCAVSDQGLSLAKDCSYVAKRSSGRSSKGIPRSHAASSRSWESAQGAWPVLHELRRNKRWRRFARSFPGAADDANNWPRSGVKQRHIR